MNDAAVRLVCFDLGGVIVRICRSLPEACEAAGLDPARIRSWQSVSPDAVAPLLHLHQTGRISIEEYAAGFCQLCGSGASADDVIAIHTAWILEEYDGVVDVIDAIHESGLETAALSNTNDRHWEQMHDAARFPSIAQIRHRWASHLLGHAKPDEAVYRAFEDRVGFQGNEILFFDDLEENIATAREVGWRAVQIDHTASTAPQILDALAAHEVLSR